MSNAENPAFLYHYTSINVLALILKNKTIRFRRLDLMDDPNESMSSDFGRQGKYVMISCWTSKTEETLLTWSLYTNNLHGVRIRLPVNPFEKKYTITQREMRIPIKDGQPFQSYLESEHIFNDRYNIPGIDFEKSLVKIEYTDDPELLNPKVFFGNAVILSNLGKRKHTIWADQEEWRYTFPIFPMTREILRVLQTKEMDRKFGALMMEALRMEQDPGVEYVDIPISDKAIQQLEVISGPRNDDAEKIILNSIIKEYAPGVIIKDSDLLGKIV